MVSEAERRRARAERFSGKGQSKKTGADDYGLLSRGEDSRLVQDEGKRRDYFDLIQRQYLRYCKDSADTDLIRIAKSLVNKELKIDEEDKPPSWTFDRVLIALRKLREATLPLPVDTFTKEVFLFSIKVAILGHSYQTYHPALVHLLDPKFEKVLTTREHAQLVNFHALHLAHFSDDLNEAYRVCLGCQRHVLCILDALSMDDYELWLRLFEAEKCPFTRALMSFAHDRIVKRALECIGKGYMVMQRSALESIVGVSWDTMKNKHGSAWVLEGDKVTIRQRKVQRAGS